MIKERGIPFLPSLPYVESEAETTIRTKDEVVDRALALCYLGVKSEGLETEHLASFDERYGITAKLTAKEKEYAFTDTPTQQQNVNANWRYESLHVMLWALGYVDTLIYPDTICQVADDVGLIFPLSEAEFRSKAQLRSKREILDEADLIYRYHWACVDARINGRPMPGNLDSSVVYERHYSLNWLTHYMDQPWNDVSTDT